MPTKTTNKPLDEPTLPKNQFDKTKDLSDKERPLFDFVVNRIDDLKQSRKQAVNGVEIEQVWAEADRDYVPHRLGNIGKRVIATDEEKGWRGTLVRLGSTNWQSDVSQSNPFIKVQVALSLLVDQNPSGVFTAGSNKFQATTELMRQLYQRSWEVADSKQQLKLFIFNLSKYGWACGRTYPLRITRTVKVLKEWNEEEPDKSVYEDQEVVEFNDVFRENLDIRNTWIDDMAKPNNKFSVRDWSWRKVYPMDVFKEEFGKYKLADKVQEGGNISEVVTGPSATPNKTQFKERHLVEVYFYENRIKDVFAVIANGVPVVLDALPIANLSGVKKLSLWQTYWNIRDANCPYGIGLYEAIRNDQFMLDRIRNMTVDQLTLSIYKMFFYQGTQALTETGDIKISPGVGKQVLDPKNVNWLTIPGPGQDAWLGIQMFKKDLDESSGITDQLLGVVTGKTAFETAQAKEAALKRLKNPLDNITDALDEEAYISVALFQLIYSIPETIAISDPRLVDDYLKEVQGDQSLYTRDSLGNFNAQVYREFPLNLQQDEKGNLIENKDTKFFRVKPKFLQWEGIINVKAQSILSPSKQIDKALELEMYNVLIPLIAQPPELVKKIAENIIKLYDKDPRDVLPESWLNPPQQQLIIPSPGGAPQQPGQAPQMLTQPPQAPPVPAPQPANNPSIVNRFMSRLGINR